MIITEIQISMTKISIYIPTSLLGPKILLELFFNQVAGDIVS